MRADFMDPFPSVASRVSDTRLANGATVADTSRTRNVILLVAVSVTGIAGPGGSEVKPEGRVCFGVMRKGHEASTETVEFGALGRDKVRRAARDRALELLSQALG